MKILLGCVNSAVSLVGYDLETHQPFWYCPGNRLRACGVHFYENALWVSSDSTLKKIAHDGITVMELPGPHENFAHSVKPLGEDCIGVVDTGNSRVTIFSGGRCVTHYSPLENWPFEIPCDAIHLNDILPWKDGILASAFSYQPFQPNKDSCPTWNSDGLGVLFYMRKYKNNLISTIIASGLNCPHSITEYNGDIYCCSSSTGTFYRLRQNIAGILTQDAAWHVTETHFLRGCLRVDSGWILGEALSALRVMMRRAEWCFSIFLMRVR